MSVLASTARASLLALGARRVRVEKLAKNRGVIASCVCVDGVPASIVADDVEGALTLLATRLLWRRAGVRLLAGVVVDADVLA